MDRKNGTVVTTTNNTYNADGLRVKKSVGGVDTYYYYLPT